MRQGAPSIACRATSPSAADFAHEVAQRFFDEVYETYRGSGFEAAIDRFNTGIGAPALPRPPEERTGVDDLRSFFDNDVRFLRQFA